MKVLQLIVIWLGFSKVQFMVMVKVGWNYPPTYTHCLKKLVFLTKIVPLLKTTVTALCSPCIWNLAMTSTRRHCQIFLMFFFFAKFSYWSKFHVTTGSGVMTIFVYEEFDQESRNWKHSRLSLAQCLETGQVRIPNWTWMYLMKSSLML